MTNKVELLSPAGDFECFLAAISAGADAVYLGGDKFGARAYANNFSTDEIIEAIKIAHLFSKKVYLTVNTLVKECEMSELIPFMTPLVEAKLDGVIVQDIGVFFTLRENFPSLELHASTQMTITGKYGAKFLKEIGATRIVPARELSLQEIREIKQESGLEVETFIHGAMCYAYSGQCLFSSILGGRSGNRGRCAGPCRLPYGVNNKTVYPLSLKDMYTLRMLPELISAGIDSFKIEGRMKSPEYVAGVTSIYRKYIDLYLSNPDAPFKVDRADEDIIGNLYIRSDICEGYYKQHNNKSMVTIHEPGYKGSDESVLNSIRKKYLENRLQLEIKGRARVRVGEPCELEISYGDISVKAFGDVVSEAKNRPLLEADIVEKLSKTGNTSFKFSDIKVDTDNNSFVAVKALNELRREAVLNLENAILKSDDKCFVYEPLMSMAKKKTLNREVYALVNTISQLKECVLSQIVRGIYINSDLFLIEESANEIIGIINNCKDKSFYISLPAILRERSYKYLDKIYNYADTDNISGVLVKNMEEYIWLRDKGYDKEYIADYSIYSWNNKANEVYDKFFTRTTLSIELNKKEIFDLSSDSKEILLYSRLPLMYSANCIQKTCNDCISDRSGKQNIFWITDRHNNKIPIKQNCFHCFNILYNPVVMSLHNQMEAIEKEKFDVYRLEFSIENKNEVREILEFYTDLFKGIKKDFPVKDYTAGHFKRGVE